MADRSVKRERAQNFTSAEIISLLNIAYKYKHVIECKESDATTWKDKDLAWSQITDDFNACNTLKHRTKKSLRSKYEVLKKITKQKVALTRKELVKTGGGVGDAPEITVVDKKLLSMMPTTVAGLQSLNDDDGDFVLPLGRTEITKQLEEADVNDHSLANDSDDDLSYECLMEYEHLTNSSKTQIDTNDADTHHVDTNEKNHVDSNTDSWSNHKAKNFRKRKHSLLQASPAAKISKTEKRKSLTDSVGILTDKKLSLLEYQLLLVQEDIKGKEEQNLIKKTILEVELKIKKAELKAQELKLLSLQKEFEIQDEEPSLE